MEHEINDCLTPKEKKALAMREARYTLKKMGEIFGVSTTGASRYYQRARRKQEKWIEHNEGLPLPSFFLYQLKWITNEIKELKND